MSPGQVGTIHPRMIFESVLAQLLSLERLERFNFASPIPCDNFSEFVEYLRNDK